MIETRFKATELIHRATRREGYESFAVVGKRGAGKTTYCVKVMTQVYVLRGYGEDDAYRLALKHLIFDQNEIITFLKNHSGRQAPVLTWDDIRAHASGYSAIMAPRQTQILLGLFDTIRDSTAGFLSTSPSVKGVLSFIKLAEGWLVKVTNGKQYNWRDGTGYSKYELPSGTTKIAKRFIDKFHCMLPDDVFQAVRQKRMYYKDIVIKNLEDRIKESNEVMAKRYAREKALVENDGEVENVGV